MPDNPDSIGSVSVSIRGDASQLSADLQEAQRIAAEAGVKVAESFNGAPVKALEELGTAAKAAGAAIAEGLATPIPTAAELTAAMGAVNVAAKELAAGELQFGEAAAAGNAEAIASIAALQAALEGTKASVKEIFAAQSAGGAGLAESFIAPIAAVNELGVAAKQAGIALTSSIASALPVFNNLAEAMAGAKAAAQNLAAAEQQYSTAAQQSNSTGQAAVSILTEYRQALASAQAQVASFTAQAQGAAIAEQEQAAAAQRAALAETEQAASAEEAAVAIEQEAVAASGAAVAVNALGAAHARAVPEIAAASGAIRTLEGALPIRVLERFAVTTLGLGPILQAAFPIIGAIAFAEMLDRMLEKINPLVEAEKKLAEWAKEDDQKFEQLARRFEQLQIEEVTARLGKLQGLRLAEFYAGSAALHDQAALNETSTKLDEATAKLERWKLAAAVIPGIGPFIQRFAVPAAEEDVQRLTSRRDTQDEGRIVENQRQRAEAAKAAKEAHDEAVRAAKELAAQLKAINDATEANTLARNSRELASAKEAIEATLNLQKLGTEESLVILDDKHTKTIAQSAGELALKINAEAQLNQIEEANLKIRLALLDDAQQKALEHGKAGAAEAIKIEGQEAEATAQFFKDKQKRAEDVNAALKSLGLVELQENKARLDEELKDWDAAANKEIDLAQRKFDKEKQIERRAFDSRAREGADIEQGALNTQKLDLERDYALSLDHSAQAQARLGEATLAIDKQIQAAQIARLQAVVDYDHTHAVGIDIVTRDEEALTRATIQGTLAIERETTHVRLLEQAANRIHQVFEGLKGDFDHAFSSLASNLSAAIIGAKSFHDAWQHTIRGVAESILNTLIGVAFHALASALGQLLLRIPLIAAVQRVADEATVHSAQVTQGKIVAAHAAADIAIIAGAKIVASAISKIEEQLALAEITDAAAVAGAEWAAANAWGGPLAAITAGLEMFALVWGTFSGIVKGGAEAEQSLDKGGWIDHDMIAQVHKGEYVLTAEQAKAAFSFEPGLAGQPGLTGAPGASAGLPDISGLRPELPRTQSAPMPQPNISHSFSSSQSSSIGEVKITVNGAQKPQETAREIARYIKQLSPKFSPASG